MIQKAKCSDLPILAELACRLWPGHSPEDMQAVYAQLLAQPDAAFFLAYAAAVPVALGPLSANPPLWYLH